MGTVNEFAGFSSGDGLNPNGMNNKDAQENNEQPVDFFGCPKETKRRLMAAWWQAKIERGKVRRTEFRRLQRSESDLTSRFSPPGAWFAARFA
jgi:hypothetical protein